MHSIREEIYTFLQEFIISIEIGPCTRDNVPSPDVARQWPGQEEMAVGWLADGVWLHILPGKFKLFHNSIFNIILRVNNKHLPPTESLLIGVVIGVFKFRLFSFLVAIFILSIYHSFNLYYLGFLFSSSYLLNSHGYHKYIYIPYIYIHHILYY